uniref:Uncharacterized protein n=1 Tax=Lates calcarifer TaxID=8187 RepID=A0A4W6CX30_LATCA
KRLHVFPSFKVELFNCLLWCPFCTPVKVYFWQSNTLTSPGADYGDGPAPYGNPSSAGFPSWGAQPAGGVGVAFSDPRKWMPKRQFPDFSAWESNVGVPMRAGDSETSPLPPSSYIIQSMNGYDREREFLSHSKYSPEYPEPPPFSFDPVKAPSKLPRTVPKGGRRT